MEESTWLGDLRVVQGEWTASGVPTFAAVETRIGAARRFVRLIEDTIERDLDRQRREMERGASHRALRRFEEIRSEFPLLAWATTLGYCFSALEGFLKGCAQDAADVIDAQAPTAVPGPQIESWLTVLRSMGVRVRLPPDVEADLKELRRLRNHLTHGLRLDEAALGNRVRSFLGRDPEGAPVPTATLVRFAIETVESVILAVDRAFIDFGETRARDGLRFGAKRRRFTSGS